jgi:hypothetical protein
MSNDIQQIDGTLSMLWPSVVAQQDAYFAMSGCYYQMLWTHSAAPSGMASADNVDARPTDQAAFSIEGLPALMRSRFKIDTYGQPAGWTMTLEAVIDGVLWSRSVDCGVDDSRSTEWHVQ